ncbi:hypothetical protein KP77_29590 [Jeotgalibacillus alimentarius]|uniref:Uncharacterized protein n=1 Tax=Jeotgalibacillus alimentarius TaxID=135826 RepID=A0A0C2R158_9BACL|nr:hypothetical protein KP77_29590 [Jeotgalibacillus alimentarius]
MKELAGVEGGDSSGSRRTGETPQTHSVEEAYRRPRGKHPLGTQVNSGYISLQKKLTQKKVGLLVNKQPACL